MYKCIYTARIEKPRERERELNGRIESSENKEIGVVIGDMNGRVQDGELECVIDVCEDVERIPSEGRKRF